MRIGPPMTDDAVRLVLLGSGELGREVAIEAMRLGCEVVAVDRYAGAPAMQVAHRSHVCTPMTDAPALRAILEEERARPCAQLIIVPEIEAIATDELVRMEAEGLRVVPTARAARLTMDREGIRRLAAEELGLETSPYRFCTSLAELEAAVSELGVPCVVKPVMSSSGKGQSVVESTGDASKAWTYAQEAGRTGAAHVIVEGFVDFDFEITQLTVRHAGGTSFCAPVGHVQIDGDYRESWQPHPMTPSALERAHKIATQITDALGGYGIFGVELFVCGDQVLFSEVSPRPHDTGMVTMVSQQLSEFVLHVRAILGLYVPGPDVPILGPAASAALRDEAGSDSPVIEGLEEALATHPSVDVRLFGKPDSRPGRRLGVALATGDDIDQARERARKAAAALRVT